MAEHQIVNHPIYGAGQLLRTTRGGYLWEVAFTSGRRYVLPYHQFDGAHIEAFSADRQFVPPRPTPDTDEFRDRQTLEALRFGVVPVQNVRDLTIGLETERANMERALLRTIEHGGDSMAIIADYGFGKSHFIELAAQAALARNFIVASASLDLVEVPPSKAREIYRALLTSLRYPPEGTHDGIKTLLRSAAQKPEIVDYIHDHKPIDHCPLSAALTALANCPSQTAHEDLINWLAAQVKPTTDLKTCLKKPPPLYNNGEVARQYAYLLSAISALAVQLGYAGLAVLIDESEHYSLLRQPQKDRADALFKTLIVAAGGAGRGRINPDSIPVDPRAYGTYPLQFSGQSRLFFMFASTESDSRMPIETWLSPAQVVRLDDRFLKEDINKFLKMVLRYHSVAYHYIPLRERYESLVTNVSAMLSRTLSQHRINIRELIRYAVTVCDLMFVHQDYLPVELESELALGLGM